MEEMKRLQFLDILNGPYKHIGLFWAGDPDQKYIRRISFTNKCDSPFTIQNDSIWVYPADQDRYVRAHFIQSIGNIFDGMTVFSLYESLWTDARFTFDVEMNIRDDGTVNIKITISASGEEALEHEDTTDWICPLYITLTQAMAEYAME
jgi:hypothetical protein